MYDLDFLLALFSVCHGGPSNNIQLTRMDSHCYVVINYILLRISTFQLIITVYVVRYYYYNIMPNSKHIINMPTFLHSGCEGNGGVNTRARPSLSSHCYFVIHFIAASCMSGDNIVTCFELLTPVI